MTLVHQWRHKTRFHKLGRVANLNLRNFHYQNVTYTNSHTYILVPLVFEPPTQSFLGELVFHPLGGGMKNELP